MGTSPKTSPGLTLADDALDPVDELDRLDAPLQHGEERALLALVRRVLARHETDIRRHPRNLLALPRVESREEGDATDLLGRHQVRQPPPGRPLPSTFM